MKLVITGSRGFIGAATARAAEAAGHEVTHFDHTDGRDIRSMIDVHGVIYDADRVIHLAGVLGTSELFESPHNAVNVNVHGALNIIRRCTDLGIGYTAISMPPVFPSIYTATKMCADRLASAYHQALGLRTSRVVAFNAYGVGQKHGPGHPQKIIPTFATEAWANRPIPIWGDGEQTVDLIHVDDIAHVLVAAASYNDDEVFDAGCGFPLTVNQVAEFVMDITGSTAGVKYMPMRTGEVATKIVAMNPPNLDFVGLDPRDAQYQQLTAAIRSYKL